jgi:hypothetical protein
MRLNFDGQPGSLMREPLRIKQATPRSISQQANGIQA